MRKSSRSISLALIGSALWLGGCQPAAVETETESEAENESEWGATSEDVVQAGPGSTLDGVATGNDQYNQQHHSGGMGRTASRIGGAMIGSQIGRAIGGGGSSVRPGYGGGLGGGGGMPASPSARGGFGSSAGTSAST